MTIPRPPAAVRRAHHYRLPLLLLLLTLLFPAGAAAHALHYRVDEQGISARFFYAADQPVSYAQYEIFGPGDTLVYKQGRTDRQGFVSFWPDRPGTWIIKIRDDSEHGMHGQDIEIEIGEGLRLESYQKPLVANHLAAFMGISVILFLYSLWVQWSHRRRAGFSGPGGADRASHKDR